MNIADGLLESALRLRATVAKLRFAPPVHHVYNPLVYAWEPHAAYLQKFGRGRKRVVFLGMNPGPFGMAQTGVPFGEVNAVRGWLGIEAAIAKPPDEHPARPITGFACPRSEVSGQRLWGLFAGRFGRAERFFAQHLVLNYCPLIFLEASGRNRTPDKLSGSERAALFVACDEHLAAALAFLKPEWLVGIGDFAFKRAAKIAGPQGPKLGRILHPSPASPAANRNWALAATRQLQKLGVWA